MDILLENNNNKFLADFLKIDNISFSYDIYGDMIVYFGKHIKRCRDYRKEDKIPYSFPKYISCVFTKNRKKFGIKLNTKDFIMSKDYQYKKMDTVNVGDGLIAIENSIFGNSKPILLPYLFIGNKYRLDTNKVVQYLKTKIKQ